MLDKFGDSSNNDVVSGGKQSEASADNSADSHESSDSNKSMNIVNLSSRALEWLNFWYNSNQQKNERLVSQFSQDAEWNSSIEWQLMQNEQVQILLSEVLSDYSNYIWTDKDRLKSLIEQENAILKENGKSLDEEQSNIIESMYQFMVENDNQVWFENFIVSNSIASIKAYLANHLDKDWNLSFYSRNEIKARLRIDWFLNLYGEYKKAHIGDEENLAQLEWQVKLLRNTFGFVKTTIDWHIQGYLSWKRWKEWMEELAKNLLATPVALSQATNWILFNKNILDLFRYTITEYARWLNISDNKLGDSWDEVYDMQIRSYLYLYWVFSHNYFDGVWLEGIKFDPNKWLDDSELFEILNSILVIDWFKQDDWTHNKYLSIEQKTRRAQMNRDIKTREETWARINKLWGHRDRLQSSTTQEKPVEDIQNATWVDIARNNSLWREISKLDIGLSAKTHIPPLLKMGTLTNAWRELAIENQEILSKYLSPQDIQQFFSFHDDTVIFREDARERFKDRWLTEHPESNVDELDMVRNILIRLPGKFEEHLEKAWIFVGERREHRREIMNNYAIGAVIDNIKDIFQYIVDTNTTWTFMTWFEFDENNSAKIENNCLILSGRFNWEVMNIKYDLKTWKLYMNSLIDVTNEKITISLDNNPISEIWEFQPFKNILDEFYKVPRESINRHKNQPMTMWAPNIPWWEHQSPQSNSPSSLPKTPDITDVDLARRHKNMLKKMCWTKIDEIWRRIRDRIEYKSLREPVVLNLLRTLGIMPTDNSRTKNIMWWSDLYRIVQLITAKENTTESINKFSEYMKVFMNMIWLDWWKDSGHQDKERNDDSKKIFNKNYVWQYISDVREYTENFDVEYENAKETAQLDKTEDTSNENESTSNKNKNQSNTFWICKIIEKHFTNGGTYPNRALDYNQIENFEKGLSKDLVSAGDEAVADELISPKNLNNYYT